MALSLICYSSCNGGGGGSGGGVGDSESEKVEYLHSKALNRYPQIDLI